MYTKVLNAKLLARKDLAQLLQEWTKFLPLLNMHYFKVCTAMTFHKIIICHLYIPAFLIEPANTARIRDGARNGFKMVPKRWQLVSSLTSCLVSSVSDTCNKQTSKLYCFKATGPCQILNNILTKLHMYVKWANVH